MKQTLRLIVLLASLLLSGCAGAGDWKAPLTGDYALCRLSGYRVVLIREFEDRSGGEIVIDAHVYRVAWNEAFIYIQRTDPPEGDEGLPIVPEVSYYILRVSDGKVFGPYAEPRYRDQCKALDIPDQPEWKYASDLAP
jgi:hypothetical protein